jgi:hypothetical protein
MRRSSAALSTCLSNHLRNLILRREFSSVMAVASAAGRPVLPPKTDLVVRVRMAEKQEAAYIVETDRLTALATAKKNINPYCLFALFHKLCRLGCHPDIMGEVREGDATFVVRFSE